MEEVEKLVESYEEFLRNADKLLTLLRNGELKPRFESAAKAIAGVEKQIRDVENILPTLHPFLPAKASGGGTPPGWTTNSDEVDRKPA